MISIAIAIFTPLIKLKDVHKHKKMYINSLEKRPSKDNLSFSLFKTQIHWEIFSNLFHSFLYKQLFWAADKNSQLQCDWLPLPCENL